MFHWGLNRLEARLSASAKASAERRRLQRICLWRSSQPTVPARGIFVFYEFLKGDILKIYEKY
jgi:hypothetical protein